MSKNQVFEGPQVSLEMMLKAREARVQRHDEWLNLYPQACLVSFTLNIPGPVKTSSILNFLFNMLLSEILTLFEADAFLQWQEWHQDSGDEALLALNLPANYVKQTLIDFEMSHSLGRLCDLDVIFIEKDLKQSISRQDLGYPPRKCLICGEDAKVCGRSRKHSVEELQKVITEFILEKGELDAK